MISLDHASSLMVQVLHSSLWCMLSHIFQARAAEESSDLTAAAEYRRQARQWNIAGIIGGVVVIVISLIISAVVLAVVFSL